MSCQLTCLPFYKDPTMPGILLTSGNREDPNCETANDPRCNGCGYCTYYQAHQELGASACQDACDIDKIVNQNPRGFTDMCGKNGWCKAAACVKNHKGKCSVIHTAMFGGSSNQNEIDAFYNKACGQCKETYCAGCAEGGYYNYYQLDNAYGPHILRR